MINNIIIIKLNGIKKVRRFVQIAEKFDSEININSNGIIVNAKSIMGVFSLDLLKPLVVKIETTDAKEIESFKEVMEEFKFESYS